MSGAASVEVMVRPDYFDAGTPYPVAVLWIDGELWDSFPCGVRRKRVQWLPLWVPFNSRYDFSLYAQLACIERLKEFGRKVRAALR